ncbi:MAG: helix-turn-helix transcriptional regulator [Alphaproteobacteria bacterium]|nr:helix-turn-helix transcriptional regulator [Alphaproteobacteria bacterium]
MAAEIVQATRRDRIAFGYRGPRHMLAVCGQGLRRDGETAVEGLPSSSLRDVTRKLTFVPAGHAYCEWHQPRLLTRMLYVYLDPDYLPATVTLPPRMLFEDATLLSIATKLERLVESTGAGSPYFEALGTVLAYELLGLGAGRSHSARVVRGGLAPWQQRAVTSYINEHLAEAITLATLARLARLSPFHFCRAFKQSLGLPPLRYQSRLRIEHAKRLLARPTSSVTEVGLAIGYSDTSSFTAAFHKVSGVTPTAYRRALREPKACEEIEP